MVWKRYSPDYPETPRPHRPVRTTQDNWNHCPSCGTRLQHDYLFCPECGKKIGKIRIKNEHIPSCSSCMRQLQSTHKVCPYCGKKPKAEDINIHACACNTLIEHNASHCVGCGKALNSS